MKGPLADLAEVRQFCSSPGVGPAGHGCGGNLLSLLEVCRGCQEARPGSLRLGSLAGITSGST